MRTWKVQWTRRVGGTTYVEPAWWALDEAGYALAGPCLTKREIQNQMARKEAKWKRKL